MDGGLRDDAPPRRDDVRRIRAPDHGRHADGWPAQRRLHRRPGGGALVAVGDAFCHTDPAFAYGLSFALAHADALGRAAGATDDVDELVGRYRAAVTPAARERLCSLDTDEARTRRWAGEAVDIGRRDGCYPLFAFAAALAAAPHNDQVLHRATIRRIGLLDRTAAFDEDAQLHERIEEIFAGLASADPPAAGPAAPSCSRGCPLLRPPSEARRLRAGRQSSCHSSRRRMGTAAPSRVIPSTSTSGPPTMKSVCTEE